MPHDSGKISTVLLSEKSQYELPDGVLISECDKNIGMQKNRMTIQIDVIAIHKLVFVLQLI